MIGHAVENYSGVKGGSFDRGEEFILSGALQVPSQRNSAQIGIHEDSSVTVVPRHAQQASLACAIALEPTRQCAYVRSCAQSDGIKNVSHGGEAGFDSGAERMHAALDDSAHPRNQIH